MAFSLIETIRQGEEVSVLAILQNTKSANIDAQTVKRDGTALFWACWKGYLKIVRLLLQRGADINAKNGWESTPLHAASDANYPEIVRYLIHHGAEIDAKSSSGDTPCHLAAYRGFAQVVQILIENGASISILNNNRRNCLHEALISGNENLVNYVEAVYDFVTPKVTDAQSVITSQPLLSTDNNQRILTSYPQSYNTQPHYHINNEYSRTCENVCPYEVSMTYSPGHQNPFTEYQRTISSESINRVPTESTNYGHCENTECQNDLSIDKCSNRTQVGHWNILE